MAHPSYLDRQLTTPVDASLQTIRMHSELPVAQVRPPQVNSLTDWGSMVIPSGKHVNKTFSEVYEEAPSYVNQMWNRHGVSTWVRSFQLYCRERRSASQEARRRKVQEEIQTAYPAASGAQGQLPVMPKSKAPQPISQVRPKSKSEPNVSEGWIQIPIDTPVPEQTASGKRGLATSSNNMETQVDPDKVSQLQTQIAILQRELQKELQGSPDSDSVP